jgi:large conductance mechanosensitive channel
MKKFFREFRDFIQKGNVLDLAVGIIIGTAFNKIVSSLVNDIIMPLVGLIGGKNIQEAKLQLVPAVMNGDEVVRNAVTLNYGNFIQYIIDFLIIALTVFVIVKVVKGMQRRAEIAKEKLLQKLRKEEEENAAEEKAKEDAKVEEEKENEVVKPSVEDLLGEIRDLLKENKT